MSEDSAGWLGTPGSIQDSLTELLRQGARGLIEKAVEAELQGLLDQYENVTDLGGRQAYKCRFFHVSSSSIGNDKISGDMDGAGQGSGQPWPRGNG